MIIVEAQKEITDQISYARVNKMSRREAEEVCKDLAHFAEDLQARVQVDLEKLITDQVHKNAEGLLEEYKKKVSELAQDLNVGDVSIDPLELMEGDINGLSNIDSVLNASETSEKTWEVVGNHKEYKEVFGLRRWLNDNLGTSFNVDYDLINDYDWVEHTYIDGKGLAERFLAPVQVQLYENTNYATEYAKKQTRKIKQEFSEKFAELDTVLKQKLQELEDCANNNKNVEQRIRESQNKLKWLEEIQEKTNAILDI